MTPRGLAAASPPPPGVPLHAHGGAQDGDGLIALLAWTVGVYMSFDGVLPIGFRERWLPLMALAVFVVARRYVLLGHLLPFVNRMLLPSMAWLLLTVTWSPRAGEVYTQAIAIVGVVPLALAFVMAGWHGERFPRALLWVCTLSLLASLLVALAFPLTGVHQESNFELAQSWRGIAYQKNGLGQLSAVTLIVWTQQWAARRVSAAAALAGAALAGLLLLQSRSSTSLMLALIACGLIVLTLRPPVFIGPGARRLWVAAAVVLLPTLIFLVVRTSVFAPIGGIFGKDGTFSGRTDIWEQMFVEIAKHPWLGIGYNSFWGKDVDVPARHLRELLQWNVPTAHNGYLEIINEQGYIGFALFLAVLGGHCIALARLLPVDRAAYALHMPLFVWMLLANISESNWYRPIEFVHLLFITSSVDVSRRLFAHARYRWQQSGAPPAARHPAAS